MCLCKLHLTILLSFQHVVVYVCHTCFLLFCSPLSLAVCVCFLKIILVLVLSCNSGYLKEVTDGHFSKIQMWWRLGLVLECLAVLGQEALGFAKKSLEHHLSEQRQGLRVHTVNHAAAFLSCHLKWLCSPLTCLNR